MMTAEHPLAIAMWSGPRNISTAMLRSWGNRADTVVCDEPFYAHYLQRTGLDHPGAAQVIEHHETDWRKVVRWLTGPVAEGKTIFYQKQMAHHLLPEIDREWIAALRNVFLIRDPDEMLASLSRVLPSPRLEDTGLPQQWELFESERRRTGKVPPVIDARDVLTDPRGALQRLCAALEVRFSESMLTWAAGRRPTDGAWAPYWYASVEKSTRFQPYAPHRRPLEAQLARLATECRRHYEKLYNHRLGV